MDSLQKGIITLLKSAVTGEALPLPEDFDMEQAYCQLRRHHVQALGYEGAVRCGVSRQMPAMDSLFRDYCKAMLVSERQMAAVEQLCAAFDAQEIAYMPVKGCNMKARYPKPELRTMGDADILIHPEQYEKVVPILEALGYSQLSEVDHVYEWQNKNLYLELHKRLIPTDNQDFYAAMGDGWQLAKIQRGCRWDMEAEDELFFLFTHFAKHYRYGGIGIGHVTDLWVFLRTNPHINENKVKQALEKLYLSAFYENIRKVIDAWFSDGEWDEKTEFITDFVFESGRWGTAEAHALSTAAKAVKEKRSGVSGRDVYLLKLVFPDAQQMRWNYPVLQKAPWLLPIMWVVRLVEKLLFDRSKFSVRAKELKVLRQENIQTLQDALVYAGLDYHF